jgi:hypothetical protein
VDDPAGIAIRKDNPAMVDLSLPDVERGIASLFSGGNDEN